MSTESTPVPSGSGGVIGWTIGVLIIVVGMVVAGFMLDAGQVYVVPTQNTYSEFTKTTPVDTWLPVGSAPARKLQWNGAEISEVKNQNMTKADAFALGMSEAKWLHAEQEGKTVDVAHLTGSEVVTKWFPKGDQAGTGWTGTGQTVSWETYTALPATMAADKRPENAQLSMSRTFGIWLAAIFTLCIMSFLIGDNPFYKTAEAVVVGSSAGYYVALNFYTGIVDKLLINVFPGLVRAWTTPGLSFEQEFDWIYLIPAILSVMLLCRLLPSGGWIARWPLAFIIGATAGFRLTSYIESDFLEQIKATITSLWVVNAGDQFMFWPSVGAVVILLGVLCCLVYFFFSMEHKGVVGKTARMGIFMLMITFGAAFGLTVMGRITLLSDRFMFLFKDWLHLM